MSSQEADGVLVATRKGMKESTAQNPHVESHGSDMPIICGLIITFRKIMEKDAFKAKEIWER